MLKIPKSSAMYFLLRKTNVSPSMEDTEFNSLSEDKKKELKEFSDSLKK